MIEPFAAKASGKTAVERSLHYAKLAEETLDNEKFLRYIRLAEFFLWLDERAEGTERVNLMQGLFGRSKQ